MRETINLNEVDNPIFYLNANNPEKYSIKGYIECFILDTKYNSIYNVKVNNGSVKILNILYTEYPIQFNTNFELEYSRNGFIFSNTKEEAVNNLKKVHKYKLERIKGEESKHNDLLKNLELI
jgi:hypothetical protein